MVEAELVGVQAQAVQGVVAVAIFNVTAHGVPHVGRVHTYLVLAARFQAVFHQTVFCGACQGVEVGDGIFAAVVHGR